MTITMSILFLSLLPGFLFLVIGALTQEAVGYGDGLSILAMGFYMEAYALWKAVGISLTLVTAYVLGQKLLQKHRYKQEQKYEQEQIHKQKQENGQIPKSGVSIQAIREFLGHKHENMTRRYIDCIQKHVDMSSEQYYKEQKSLVSEWRGSDKDGN